MKSYQLDHASAMPATRKVRFYQRSKSPESTKSAKSSYWSFLALLFLTGFTMSLYYMVLHGNSDDDKTPLGALRLFNFTDDAFLNGTINNHQFDLLVTNMGVNTDKNGTNRKPQKLLLWNKIHGRTDWYMAFPKNRLEMPVPWCPTPCTVSIDRSKTEGADALMFHGRDPQEPPKDRNPDQLYVFTMFESPMVKEGGGIINGSSFYNWTATYSHDSDVFCPYFSFYRKPDVPQGIQMTFSAVRQRIGKQKKSFFGSTGLVAWIVSNCRTPSRREQYARELSNYVRVDIYGRCKNHRYKCPGNNQDIRKCHSRIAQKYKFYLAFENSICEDYITEKAGEPMIQGMVPIVMGARRYSHLLPPNSYIDVTRFRSVKQLAQFLKLLDRDHDAYMAFHRWRNHYTILDRGFIADCFCQTCIALAKKKPRENRKSVDADKFWTKEKCDNSLTHQLFTGKLPS